VLSEELLELERRVDHIRLVCVDTAQKLVACQPTAARIIDPDKRRVGIVLCAFIITYRRGEMYIGRGRLCVYLSVSYCIPTLLH